MFSLPAHSLSLESRRSFSDGSDRIWLLQLCFTSRQTKRCRSGNTSVRAELQLVAIEAELEKLCFAGAVEEHRGPTRLRGGGGRSTY